MKREKEKEEEGKEEQAPAQLPVACSTVKRKDELGTIPKPDN